MAGKAAVAGVDIGTESLRTVFFDLEGNVLASASYPYPTSSPVPGHFEQDPTDWWVGLKTTVPQCLSQAQLPAESVIGLGFAGTSCTVAPVDRQGQPLRPALMWMDTRAHVEAEELTSLRHPAVMQASGHVSAEWMAPKALWLKRYEPHIWERTYKLVEGPDYLIWKLSGRWTVATGSAVGKRHWVRSLGGWPTSLYDAVGLSEFIERNADDVLFPTQPAGVLSDQAAYEVGLRPGTVLVNAGPDAYIGMVGSNALAQDKFSLVTGSSNVHLAPLQEKLSLPGMWGPWCDIHQPNQWLIEGGQLATGVILRWFVAQFAPDLPEVARQKGCGVYSLLDQQAASIAPGSDGLIVLDYWRGNRTPFNDAQAAGAIWGLTLDHSRAHVYRAILEGVAYGTAHTLLEFSRVGLDFEVIVASGGGTRSNLWLQIYADACGLPVQTIHFSGATALGAAICAAVATGQYTSLSEAAGQMVRVERTIKPRPDVHHLYAEYVQQYIGTYLALRENMHTMFRMRTA
jgi:FGGY-family pentulose kinase